MYITPRQKKKYFIVTILLLIGLPLTVFAAISAVRYFSSAGGSETPQNVVLSNLTSTSMTVSWNTDAQTAGSVTVNSGKGDSKPFLDTRGTDKRKTHFIEIVDLDPSKEYSFTILSNTKRYTDENGSKFKFTTSPITSDTPIPKPVYGSLSGDGMEDAVVYILLNGSTSIYPAAAATTTSGKWIVDLSSLRDPASSKIVTISSDTVLNIVAKGPDTLGGTVSGTYSELVDEGGELATSVVLSDAPVETLFALIPKVAQISVVKEVVTNSTSTDTNTNTSTNTNTDTNTNTSVVTDSSKWVDLAGTTVSGNVTKATGKSSIQVTNLTDAGFSINWLSSTKVESYMKYGTVATTMSDTVYDTRDSLTSKSTYYVHSFDVTRLQPETKYYYEVYSGTTLLSSGNLTTFKTLSNPPEYKSISGKISGYSDSSDAVVTVSFANSTVSSSLTDSNGNWVVTIGDIRNASGTSYFAYTDTDKVQIDAILYANTDEIYKVAKNIESANIEIKAKTSASGRTIVKVNGLKNYGVY
ncbi:fibronectin type III domain-containing protein [Candidatus Dojkabacteria bacterium]|jgi:hypothetical protein|nr:fibronectin type III domain-containing protein [Candidatus Dojkabacteria bacterium]